MFVHGCVVKSSIRELFVHGCVVKSSIRELFVHRCVVKSSIRELFVHGCAAALKAGNCQASTLYFSGENGVIDIDTSVSSILLHRTLTEIRPMCGCLSGQCVVVDQANVWLSGQCVVVYQANVWLLIRPMCGC